MEPFCDKALRGLARMLPLDWRPTQQSRTEP